MMPGGWMWGSGFGIFHWLLMLLFWVLIIAGAVLIVRWLIDQARPAGSGTQETAVDILKKRYASGEITKEQFDAMKHDLA